MKYDTPAAALLASLDGIEARARRVLDAHEQRAVSEARGLLLQPDPDEVISARYQLHHAGQVRALLSAEPRERAHDVAYFALRLGVEVTRERVEEYAAKLRVAEPFAETGRKVKNANPNGRPGADPDAVRRDVQRELDRLAQRPNTGRTILDKARRAAADRHGLSYDRVKKLSLNMRPSKQVGA